MKETNTLYFFTATYPYGLREGFIEDEIKFLTQRFDKIVVIPMVGKGAPTRQLPENCLLLKPIINSRWIQYIKGLLLPLSLPVFVKDFFNKKVYCNLSRIKAWLIAYVISNNLLSSYSIKRIFRQINPEDVCYFYWGTGGNILAYFYRGKAHFVSRFHGEWDLWEELSGDYAPNRDRITSCLDYAIFISRKGEKYFNLRYPYCPTKFIPLGTVDKGIAQKSNDCVLRVVSCSTIYWLKRVDLIFRALCLIKDRKVEWHHIGIGPDEKILKEKVKKECPDNLIVIFEGRLKHEDVFNFFKNNRTDVFVNASTNEGVPVSIMEAISFNIPVVATNVGGTSEVVTEETGILVSPNPTAQELSAAIVNIQSKEFTPRVYWESHYNADNNYRDIAHLLSTLS